MKIVIALHHYLPRYFGGVEVYTRRMVKWLIATGHTVEIVAVEQVDAERDLVVTSDIFDGVPVHRLGLSLAGSSEPLTLRFEDDAVRSWFAQYFQNRQPDLFHCQSAYLLTGSAIEAAHQCGIPVVATLHGYWFFCPQTGPGLVRPDGEACLNTTDASRCSWCLMTQQRRFRYPHLLAHGGDAWLFKRAASETGPLQRIIEMTGPRAFDAGLLTKVVKRQRYLKRVLSIIDQIVVLSPLALDLLSSRQVDPARVRFLPSGLDVGDWKNLPRVPGNGSLRVAYLGRLAPEKGPHVLVQAFQHLKPTERAIELQVHGDAAGYVGYAAELRRQAARLPNARFFGRYDSADIEAILRQVDVVVVPSVCFEVRPLVIMEAFAAGVPVIAPRSVNFEHMVRHDVDGLLFDPGDSNDLARQLQRLLDDPELLKRLAGGIGAVRTVEDEMLELESIYKSLTHNSSVCGTPPSTQR